MLSHASDELSEWMERALSVTTTLHRNTGRPGQQHQRNDLAFPKRCPTVWNAEREFGVRNRPGERAWVRRPRGSQQTTYEQNRDEKRPGALLLFLVFSPVQNEMLRNRL